MVDETVAKSIDGVGWIFQKLGKFIFWFYLTVLPFIIKYIGIPMFLLGFILAVSFAGGTVLFTIVFFLVMYFFVKKLIFNTQPKLA